MTRTNQDMTSCDRQLLGAYHDGELPEDQRAAVEQHVRDCPACTDELRLIQQAAAVFTQHAFDDLTDEELARVHEALDQSESQPLLKLVKVLTVAAASILIVSCAWLMELPAATDPIARQSNLRRPEPWEQVATSLRPDPLSLIQDDPIRFANADMADWMLAGLNRRTYP